MTRPPASLPLKHRLFRTLFAALTVVSLPGVVLAQEDQKQEIVISADRMTGRPDREVQLEGDVEVVRGPTTVYADEATYDIIEDEVHAVGNIRLLRMGEAYTGEELRLRIAAGKGYVSQPTYLLERNGGRGQAKRIDFEGRDQAVVHQGTYSTCEAPDPDWYLRSSRLALDKERDRGVAYSTWVYFKDVPIMALPVMSFPLSDARKSGVLPPSFGTTNRGGFEVTLPYYFNIASNRDLTLYPKLYSRRGLQIGAEARYLGERYAGETEVEALPDDQEAGRARYAISSTHSQRLGSRWSLAWNLNHASDDAYPTDFANTRTAASERLLTREMNLGYSGNLWGATLRASNYQVLQDPVSPISEPYARLPELRLFGGRRTDAGFEWYAQSELTRFWHDTRQRGQRLVINPQISYPFLHPGYFFTPRLAVHASSYDLETPGVAGATRLSRVLPTLALDSGLIFERDTHFFGEASTQTLEPRLFYVYTPYRDQTAFPLFDTAEADISFAQLFSENRFIGHDRVADANHLTAAAVSRYLDAAGAERMRLALAQRYYLTPQRVTLAGGINQGRSDILLAAYGRVTSSISVDGNVQYSQTLSNVSRANLGARWSPRPLHVLNLQYRRDRPNNLEQFDVSTQWPFASRWYGVARVNYSIQDNSVAETLFGVEYKEDCWIVRLVAERTPTSTSEATTSMFLQLELTGLTRIGSNPLDALRTHIPGYRPLN